MNKLIAFFLIDLAIVFLCCNFTLAATENNNHLANATKLRFGTEATYPPFEFIDASGQIVGFDIDIAKALCVKMKVECSFETQAFDSLIPSLKLGKFNALIAGISITADRAKQVAFTDAYYEPSAAFVAATNKHLTIEDLKKKTIGVQAGTTFENYLRDNYKNIINIKLYGSILDAFLDLKAERIDAVLTDAPIAASWLQENNNNKTFSIVGKPFSDKKYFGSGYGIAVRKDDKVLLDALNQALKEIKADGEYDAIQKKYFSG